MQFHWLLKTFSFSDRFCSRSAGVCRISRSEAIWETDHHSITDCPGEYIGKCTEAFDRFDLPEEIHEQYRELFDFYDRMGKLFDRD